MLAQAKTDTLKIPLPKQTIPKQKISKRMEKFYGTLRTYEWKANLTKLRNQGIFDKAWKPQDSDKGKDFPGNDGSRWEFLDGDGKVGMSSNSKVFKLIVSPVPLEDNF